MNGLMLGVPQSMDYLKRMQERITKFITDNSHITPQRMNELSMNTKELVLDVGTVLDGPQAVKEGLIDSLGSLSDAIDCLYRMIDESREKAKQKTRELQRQKLRVAKNK
jgi:ATP-dependent protease ClpP protease subunit